MNVSGELREAVKSTETFGTTAAAILEHLFGPAVYTWEALTIVAELQELIRTAPSDEFMDRFSAMQVAMMTDMFFQRLDGFRSICNALDDGDPGFQIVDPVTLEEMTWGVFEVSLNRDVLPFSPTIQDFVQLTASEYGDGQQAMPLVLKHVIDPEGTPGTLHDAVAGWAEDAVGGNPNRAEATSYLVEQLDALLYQLGRIPELGGADAVLSRLRAVA